MPLSTLIILFIIIKLNCIVITVSVLNREYNMVKSIICLLLFMTFTSNGLADGVGFSIQELRHGGETKIHEEVGMFKTRTGMCTATLISPSHILTAAHCIKYLPFSLNPGDFETENSAGVKTRHTVHMMFASGLTEEEVIGKRDWAVGVLLNPISSISPASIASRQPRQGESLTVLGYGCNNPGEGTGSGIKRYIEYLHRGGTQHYCSGDSGGPTFLGGIETASEIVRITSGTTGTINGSSDRGGDAVKYRDEILSIVNSTPVKKNQICYRVHVKEDGWMPMKCNGNYSGTVNESRRIEAIQVLGGNLDICYSTHIRRRGWLGEICNGKISGTTDQALRMEAIKLRIKNSTEGKSVWYRSHVRSEGWGPWVSNNSISGTVGESKRMEAIRIEIR